MVGLWAVGAQSFPEPFNKLIAVLSPGIGYLVGHALDGIIEGLDKRSSVKAREKDLSDIDAAISRLTNEKNNSDRAEVIEIIDKVLMEARKKRVEIEAIQAGVKVR
jgi:hypothetical protein